MADISVRKRIEAELRRRAASVRTEHPLSYGQRSMWLLNRMDPDSAAYNIAFVARVTGPIDPAALRDALRSLAGRHEALRTTFAERDGDTRQIVHGWLEPSWAETEASNWSPQRLREEIRTAYRQPFDVVDGPPVRVTLLRTAPDRAVLLLVIHHLVADFRTLEFLLDELGTLYVAERGLGDGRLSSDNTPYHSFVAWQRDYLADGRGAGDAAHWRARLSGELETTRWPAFHTDPEAAREPGASEYFQLDGELTKRVLAFARQENTTPYIVQLTAFQALIARYTGQDDVLVGAPVAGRTDSRFRSCAGYFTDPVVLRADLSGDPSFAELVRRTRTSVTEALDHQDYPFERLVQELAPRRTPGVNPVFQTMFVYQKPVVFPGLAALHWGDESDGGPAVGWADLELRPWRLPQQEGQLDLQLEVVEDGERLLGTLKYRPALFSPTAVRCLIENFSVLLGAAMDDPSRGVATLPLVAEPGAPRAAGAAPAPVIGADDSLLRRFEESVAAHADRVAVRCGERELTYRALDDLGTAWAAVLRTHGVGQGDRVALLLEPSVETLVALIGTLKAGAAYVPLDPHHPPARLAFLFADCGASVVLTTRSLAGLLSEAPDGVRALYVDGEPPAGTLPFTPERPAAGDLLYTVYTSGSTGLPKGIDVEHRNVLSLVEAMREHVTPDPEAVWTLFHSTAFDVSVWELWGCLLSGARLVVVPADVARAPDAFRRLLVDEAVTHLNQTPSALHGLASEVAAAGSAGLVLQHTFACGELLSADLSRSALAWCGTLWNLYGPAETTVCVTAHDVRPEHCTGTSVPVGTPLANASVHILDARRQPVPAEVPGELYIGGQAVARGYLDRPDLLAERYLPDPFTGSGGGRMYRTGDLARITADGLVEILGRVDNQVKISGYRIELEEIEAVLDRQDGVDRSIVLVEGDSTPIGRRLTACVAPADPAAAPEEARLRARLHDALPAYMVPTSFVFVDAMPLNPNQKVDRGELARRVGEIRATSATARGTAGPPTVTRPLGGRFEQAVVAVWRDVLRREGIGPLDNFFDIGGTSLLLLQVHRRLRELPGARPVGVSELFGHPTVASQAARLAPAGQPADDEPSAAGTEHTGRDRAARRRAAQLGTDRAALRRGHRAGRTDTAGGEDDD
ncbi:non-ribosomal peptide synthetase [Streptomyces sp. NBC_01092]|uniref:non-ribosomal peptide synthetase n=1 Tax=Streptomyces sp. NBC_01092 TaxID=2903748 RepID=UPI00386B1B3B|nr:amino acid adenylation domain-containing protein [Streptomyces sp. NBC_01092]